MSGFSRFIGMIPPPSRLLVILDDSIMMRSSVIDIEHADAIITSKYNKPFPVTLIPSAIGYWLGVKQGERQAQVLNEIRALGKNDMQTVERIADAPK